jgi:ABC-2 type transport system ATP-binding protein
LFIYSDKLLDALMGEAIISVEGLTKVFNNTIRAVDNVSFSINKGEIFSLLGPNGAGKTTTVEILEGLQDPTSGDAEVLGASIKKGLTDVRSRIGILPQEFEPFDLLKPPEFLKYFGELYGKPLGKDETSGLLKTVGLYDRRKSISMNLSGGEKRKLGIALSLVSDPELMFLDEPTTGLDAQSRRALWALITRLKEEGKTIFLTTHYLEEAEELADRVAIMHMGKIIEIGTPRQLIEASGGNVLLVLENTPRESSGFASRLMLESTYEGTNLKITIPKGQSIKGTVEKMTGAGAKFTDFYTTRPTLEDAFLSLVGSKLENGELKE